MIAVIADVKGGSKEVTGTFGSILVVTLQTRNIILGAQNAGDDELLEGNSLDIKTVLESLTDVLQQQGSTGH